MAGTLKKKCEHGYCGSVRKQRELAKRWAAREIVSVGTYSILVCESCRGHVVTNFRLNGNEPTFSPLQS